MSIVYPIIKPRINDDPEWYKRAVDLFSYSTYAGSPIGNAIPRFIGDRCLDTTNDNWYVSHGTTSDDWGSVIFPHGIYYPNSEATDHGVTGDENTIRYAVDTISTDTATIYLRHDSGSATTTYTLTTSETIPEGVNLVIENGAIIDGAGTLTFNSPSQIIANPDQIIFGSTITLAFTIPGTLFPEWKGAVGDGSTDDSTAIQAVIDALETPKGGTVQFLSKTYVGNIEAKSYVELRGASPMFKGSATGTQAHNKTFLKANATGHIITTAASTVYDITIRNLGFIGLGSATALKGIYLQDVERSLFEDLAFDNIANEAIRINAGGANHFNRIFAQNCLLDTSQAAKIGVLHIELGANDNWVSDSEFTASSTSLSDANSYICAVVVDSSNNFIQDVVGEISDVGIHVTTNGEFNRLSGCRSDLNYGHGFEILGGVNTFSGCTSISNGHETDNTYDGFNSVTGSNNIFSGCMAISHSTDTEKHRYGFYDDVNSATNRSIYVGCFSKRHETASYSANAFLGIGPLTGDEGMIPTTADDATPSVDGYKFFDVSAATGALNITDFDDGTPGQVIYVMDTSANGYVTLVHNTAVLVTLSGSNIVMQRRRIHQFKLYNGVWFEVGEQQFAVDETAAGAGTDGTISSRSAGALGECDGFAKLYKADGTLVYVPYWEDIEP